jgi:predicted enzyme related to lactoylglutathione lyase
MPDPFEALRSPPVPVEPDPAFTVRLRARVERALTLPRGVIVSETTLESGPVAEPVSAPAPAGLVPYVIVADARRALDWYVGVLGARRRGDPIVMGDGRIGHAELELGANLLYLADESPESQVAAPRPGENATVSLVIEVSDVDSTVGRAVAAGATLERAPADNPYGRNAVVRDPFNHRWMVSASADAPGGGGEPIRQGDIGYASLFVPDVERAQAFFGAVLGWEFAPGSGTEGRQVVGVTPHHGLWGGIEQATLFLCFAVDDVDTAVERVRAAGGEAGEPTEQPYGRVADCTDNQGTRFALFRPPGNEPVPRGPAHGARGGDLAYVTMEVTDSALARAFYGTVLGWHFEPGRVDDGWQLSDVRPGTGMRGGQTPSVTVPMYLVDDVDAAVDRVRAAGGTATDPEDQPYGRTATCTDDQGTHFNLGQL